MQVQVAGVYPDGDNESRPAGSLVLSAMWRSLSTCADEV